MKVVIDDCRLERMDAYTEPLEAKIRRQAAEIARLLAENAELKKDLEYYHTGTDICDIESARAEGQNEAWKLAHKMSRMGFDEAAECFPDYDLPLGMSSLTKKYSYTEAAAKVAEWERKKEEICVGDVVRFKSNNRVEFCVTDILDDSFLYGISAEGDVYSDRDIKLFEKTGRHIDIASMLARIGGGSDETEN